jgi:ParB/RepB/Spo0J family partition protein
MSTEQYLDIPLDQLHDSPTQPRLVYPEAYIAELAADIKSHGRNLQALLVRPRVPALFAAVGDAELARDATAGYEVVFGHCRKRGIALAGLPTARCEVRQMSDQEAERAQISENLSRKDVHPFEEAQGFQALIDRHGDTADAIAERHGKSRSYIYGRLKLLQACPAVRKACLAGEIDAEVALLISRLRTVKLQEKAIARINAKHWDLEDGGQKSYRNIRDLLQEEFTLNLKTALFSVTDPALLPSAGACTTCPKRSANAPEFEDLVTSRRSSYGGTKPGDANLCTDPDCFQAKKVAHLKVEAEALQKKHGAAAVVIDGNKARNAVGADGTVKNGYLPLTKEVRAQLDQTRALGRNTKIPPGVLVLIQNPRDGKVVEAVKESDLVAHGLRKPTPKEEKKESTWQAQQRKQEEEDRRKREKAAQATAVNVELLQRVRTAARSRPRDAQDLSIVARAAVAGVQHGDRALLAKLWGHSSFEALVKAVGSMPVTDLEMLMLDCALVEDVTVNPWRGGKPTVMADTAKRYGVSLAPEAAKPAAPVKPAAPLKQPKGKQHQVQYRNTATGETWSGRGLQPKWLKAALDAGGKLDDYLAKPTTETPAAAVEETTA